MSGTLGGSAAGLEDGGVAERLGTDIRYVNPPYIGPPLPDFGDGSSLNLWGVRRRPMANEYGEYAEPVGAPYAAWTRVEEAEKFAWPSPDWFDYSAVEALCGKHPDAAIAAGGTYVQDFINGPAFGRGVEQVLLDIAAADPVYCISSSGAIASFRPTSNASWRPPAGESTSCSAATTSAPSAGC